MTFIFTLQVTQHSTIQTSESISRKSLVLLAHLAMLLTSTFAINCSLINFAKFLNFIDDTMI